MNIKQFTSLLIFTFLASCSAPQESGPSASEQLANLFEQERAWYYAENPGTGLSDQQRPVPDRMQAVTPIDQQRRMDDNQSFLDKLNSIDKSALSDADQLNHDLFRFMLNSRLTMAKHRTWRMPILSDSGFHTRPPMSLRSVTFLKADDYQTYFLAMNDIPRYIDENIENMRLGVKENFTMPKVVLDGLLPSFAALANKTGENSDFYRPYINMASGIPNDERTDLRNRAIALIDDVVVPAY
ncbi:MAG: DUF885 family protein, partial [Emcibacteraceae bacterium]|nr:DUF885 family protein [Emcibacteraceae bacterium]